MATIDEILAAMPEPAADAAYEYLTIDPETRTITVPEAEEIFGVEQDTKTERKHFLCPRFVGDGLDLASCFLSIKYRNANGEKDEYLVDDVALVAGDYITFSWLLYTKPIAYKGEVQFRLYADNGAGKDWGTTLASGTVLEGLETELEAAEEQTADVIAQLRATVEVETAAVEIAGTQQIQAVQEAAATSTQEARAQIEAKGEATLATIPEDYTALQAQADKLTRDRAAAIVCSAEGSAVVVTDASNDPLQGLRIFGRSTQDGTPSPDAPVEIVSLAAPKVQVCGKNLLPFPYKEGTVTKNGVTFTVQDDGSIHLEGTATKAANLSIFSGSLPLHGSFTLSGAVNGTNPSTHYLQPYVDGVFQAAQFNGGLTYEINGNLTALTLYVKEGATVDYVVRPQLEPGTVATEYEAPTTQQLAIITPNGLPGIPVTTGGNYTDASGQAWICDEVDLARGVYVQRVRQLVLDGTEAWTEGSSVLNGMHRFYIYVPGMAPYAAGPGICSHYKQTPLPSHEVTSECVRFGDSNPALFFFVSTITDTESWVAYVAELSKNGNPITVQFALATPIEHALTAEEIQGFLALHSNKPTTTVLNDAGAWMAVDYAADPKLYIDRKIAELASVSK